MDEEALDKYKKTLLDVLLYHINALVQSSAINDPKDIDFLVADLETARRSYIRVLQAANQTDARNAISEWVDYDETD